MNVFKVAILAFLLFAGTAAPALAQKEIVTQHNGWYMFFGNHRLNAHWGLHTEFQWRRSEWITQNQQLLIRVGADYHLDENNSLTAGYAWVKTFPYGEQPINEPFIEHRIWEQWLTNHRSGRLYVNHRYRLEQRFLEQPATSEFVFRQRARYRLLLTLPLEQRDFTDNSFFLATYAEVFLGFGKGIGRNVMDQSRLYLALGYRFNPRVNLQLGYLNQYIIKPDGLRHERNHTLQCGLTYNLDLRNKED
mgnify:CR=1 FL=1